MGKRMDRHHKGRLSIATVLIGQALLTGCRQTSETTVTQPAASQPAVLVPSTQTSQAAEARPPAPPKPPAPAWVTFRKARDETAPKRLNCEWTGGNRLEIISENVSLLTLDLTRLPAEAPKRGPWTLQIDKQGIEIYGKQGKVMELARSRNGDWTVVPDSQRAKQ